MQSNTTENTSLQTLSILDLSRIMEEQEKFDSSQNQSKDLKLLVDFKQLDLEFSGKQIELGSIKYKNKKVNKNLKKEVIDFKKKPKGNNSLF
jgi:hypothetical protein